MASSGKVGGKGWKDGRNILIGFYLQLKADPTYLSMHFPRCNLGNLQWEYFSFHLFKKYPFTSMCGL
jgi:hypothetical protein